MKLTKEQLEAILYFILKNNPVESLNHLELDSYYTLEILLKELDNES